MVEADACGHLGRGLEIEVVERVDVQALDGLGMLLGDFLDFGAAVSGGQHVVIAGGAVHGDGHVVFVQDVLGFGHQHAGHLVPVDGHRQDLLGFEDGLVTVVCDLDAARLSAMSDLHLSLDVARIADFLGCLRNLMGILGENGTRCGDVLFFKQLACLVFVKIHGSFPD